MNIRRFVTLVLLLLTCPALAWGDELCFVPTLAVKEEYNTNVLLVPGSDPNNLKKDYITTLSPGFELIDKTEKLDLTLALRLDRLQYSRNSDLSATNPQYSFGLGQAASHRLTFSAKADYQKNSNLSLNTGPALPGPQPGDVLPALPEPPPTVTPSQPSPLPGLPSPAPAPNPALPLVATAAERISSSVSMGFQLTAMTKLSGAYQYSADSYEKPRYRDTSHGVQAGLETDLGMYIPRVKGRLNMGYSQFLLPDAKTVNVEGTIGFAYDISQIWGVVVDGGLRRTKSEQFVNQLEPLGNETPPTAFAVVRERLDNTEWGRVGHLAFNYRGEYTGVELGYTKDVTLASGLQAATEQNALSLSLNRRITYELSAALTTVASTQRSNPANTAAVVRQNNFSISPLVRYDLINKNGERDLSFEAGYERTLIDYLALNTKANREVYFIRLSARFPFCSSSQYK